MKKYIKGLLLFSSLILLVATQSEMTFAAANDQQQPSNNDSVSGNIINEGSEQSGVIINKSPAP